MPRLDGFEVLERVRRQPRFNGLVIVIFSASTAPRDVSRAYSLGANDYMAKPHSMEELVALVGRFKKHWLEPDAEHRRKAA